MANKYRQITGRGRSNFFKEPMPFLYTLVAGGLLLALVIRIAMNS